MIEDHEDELGRSEELVSWRSHVSKIVGVHLFLHVPTNVQLQRPKASMGEEWGVGAPPPASRPVGSVIPVMVF